MHPNTIRHTLQITSHGGVGTTFLYKFAHRAGLNIYLPADGGPWSFDYGRWKHLRRPIGAEMKIRPGYRVVYLIGNPYDSVISLYRRQLHSWAAQRLEAVSDKIARFNPEWSLAEYLAQQEDFFELEEHVRNWTSPRLHATHPILVIKYETLDDNRDVLLDFMEVPQEKRALFPQIHPRNSSHACLSEAERENLVRVYGSLAAYVDSLPDWFIH